MARESLRKLRGHFYVYSLAEAGAKMVLSGGAVVVGELKHAEVEALREESAGSILPGPED